MSGCKIDHSVEDVQKKLIDQKSFLPKELYNSSAKLLDQQLDQEVLNALFHLLKKYDLASAEEKVERNERLTRLLG